MSVSRVIQIDAVGCICTCPVLKGLKSLSRDGINMAVHNTEVKLIKYSNLVLTSPHSELTPIHHSKLSHSMPPEIFAFILALAARLHIIPAKGCYSNEKIETNSFLSDILTKFSLWRQTEIKALHLGLLTLVLLNPDIPCLCKQCRSWSVGSWYGSAMFAVKYVNL